MLCFEIDEEKKVKFSICHFSNDDGSSHKIQNRKTIIKSQIQHRIRSRNTKKDRNESVNVI